MNIVLVALLVIFIIFVAFKFKKKVSTTKIEYEDVQKSNGFASDDIKKDEEPAQLDIVA